MLDSQEFLKPLSVELLIGERKEDGWSRYHSHICDGLEHLSQQFQLINPTPTSPGFTEWASILSVPLDADNEVYYYLCIVAPENQMEDSLEQAFTTRFLGRGYPIWLFPRISSLTNAEFTIAIFENWNKAKHDPNTCLLYTSPSPRD